MSELVSVPRSRLSFLPLELLVVEVGLCRGKGYFFPYLYPTPLNVADIQLEFLLNRLPESVQELCFPLDLLAIEIPCTDGIGATNKVVWLPLLRAYSSG